MVVFLHGWDPVPPWAYGDWLRHLANEGNTIVYPADLSKIDPQTLLAVVAGPGDPLPGGEAQARSLLRSATRAPATHRAYLTAPRDTGPAAENPASRRTFWRPFDRLIAAARRSS